jgi:serine/threonine-protein kinase SRPK3
MGRLENSSLLEKRTLDEFKHSLRQKVLHDQIIYLSRNQYGRPENIAKVLCRITITDFRFDVEGKGPYREPIPAEPLCAPEVIADAGWSYSADILTLGVMVNFSITRISGLTVQAV